MIATDQDPRALACARANIERLGLTRLEAIAADLFPEERAALVLSKTKLSRGKKKRRFGLAAK